MRRYCAVFVPRTVLAFLAAGAVMSEQVDQNELISRLVVSDDFRAALLAWEGLLLRGNSTSSEVPTGIIHSEPRR